MDLSSLVVRHHEKYNDRDLEPATRLRTRTVRTS